MNDNSSYVSMTISDIVLNHSTTTTPKCIQKIGIIREPMSEVLCKGRRWIQ